MPGNASEQPVSQGAPEVDARRFRDTLGRFATGVTVVTTAKDDTVSGMTANGFMSVSLDPALVLVSVARRARLHDTLRDVGRYAVSVLSCEQERLSRHFAGRPIEGLNVQFDWIDGVPLVKHAVAHVIADVVDPHPAGDHTLFIGEVEHFASAGGAPLVFHGGQYRSLGQDFQVYGYGDAWDFALGS